MISVLDNEWVILNTKSSLHVTYHCSIATYAVSCYCCASYEHNSPCLEYELNRNAELEQILRTTEDKLVEKDEYIEQMEKTVLDIEMEKNQLIAKLERKSADLKVVLIFIIGMLLLEYIFPSIILTVCKKTKKL